MSRPALEVADIFRDRGPAWRQANAGHVSLDRLKVMLAIEICRTAALAGDIFRDISGPTLGGFEGHDTYRVVVLPGDQIGDRGFQIGPIFAGLAICASLNCRSH